MFFERKWQADMERSAWKMFLELLRRLEKSERFRNLKLMKYISTYHIEKEMQFAAITMDLGGGMLYIVYRGTDDSVVGIKEAINLCVMTQIPSHQEAVAYFEHIASTYMGYKFYFGGHSKGGNLAIFAAAYASSELKSRIERIYNVDGPGFRDVLSQNPDYISIANKIRTFVPESSLVGMLLEHETNYCVVQSTEKGFAQHYGFSWVVNGNSFSYLAHRSLKSLRMEYAIRQLLMKLPIEKRRYVIKILFSLIPEESKTIGEVIGEKGEGFRRILKTYRRQNKKDKKLLKEMIWLFVKENIKSIFIVRSVEAKKDSLNKNEIEEK